MSLQHSVDDIKQKAAKIAKCRPEEMKAFQIVKRSIDARKKPELYFSYSVRFRIKDEKTLYKKKKDARIQICEEKTYQFPQPGEKKLCNRPVIVGMGPAGLFCGYYLAKNGYRPLLIERGKDVESRTKDVEEFWNGGKLLLHSNVQFGEGGAGTFSDGN